MSDILKNKKACRKLRENFAGTLFNGLMDSNTVIWRNLVENFVGSTKRPDLVTASMIDLWYALAEKLAASMYPLELYTPEPKKLMTIYNEILTQAGLKLLESPPEDE